MKNFILYSAFESCRDFDVSVVQLTPAQVAELGAPDSQDEWLKSEDELTFNPDEDCPAVDLPCQVDGVLKFWKD